jgi:hypothetical protein
MIRTAVVAFVVALAPAGVRADGPGVIDPGPSGRDPSSGLPPADEPGVVNPGRSGRDPSSGLPPADGPAVVAPVAPGRDQPGGLPPAAVAHPVTRPEPRQSRALSPLAVSWGVTGGLVVPGLVLLKSGGGAGTVGFLLVWNGIVGGPAVGSFSSGHPALATLGLFVRGIGSAIAILGTIGEAMSDGDRPKDYSLPEMAAVITGGMVLVEPLICVALGAPEERPARDGGLAVIPTVVSSPAGRSGTPGLALVGTF